MSERDPLGFALVIVAMTIVVYLCRAGGFWLIGRVTIAPRLRKMLDALPGAVIAATVAPLLVHGGVSALCAVGAAAVAMVAVRNDFAAVAAGACAAALVRLGGF
jgi:uncharacterized membrane protein